MIKASPAASRLRPEIDTVIFDMDGVLLDITDSIRTANCLCVPYYLRTVLGWPAPDDLVTPDDIELFKHAGGFNDDVELTRAIVLHYITKENEHPGATPDTLNVFRPSLADFARRISERGGGLKAAEEICFEHLSRDTRDAIQLDYRTNAIRHIFEEMFAGEHTQDLYGYSPEYYHGPGFVNYDKPIIETTLLTDKRRYGVLTGRSRTEAKLGLRMARLESIIADDRLVTPSEGPRKPDPRGLRVLTDRLAGHAIYIGDTLDDFRTVARYNKKFVPDVVISALVLTGPLGAKNRKIFERSGADVIADDVNELLRWLDDNETL